MITRSCLELIMRHLLIYLLLIVSLSSYSFQYQSRKLLHRDFKNHVKRDVVSEDGKPPTYGWNIPPSQGVKPDSYAANSGTEDSNLTPKNEPPPPYGWNIPSAPYVPISGDPNYKGYSGSPLIQPSPYGYNIPVVPVPPINPYLMNQHGTPHTSVSLENKYHPRNIGPPSSVFSNPTLVY